LTLFDGRYIPAAIVVDYELLTLPIVVAVTEEGELDTEFFPKRVLKAFAEFSPEPSALDKVMVIVVESDKYTRHVAAELIELGFGD
jgi:hypothetical protein